MIQSIEGLNKFICSDWMIRKYCLFWRNFNSPIFHSTFIDLKFKWITGIMISYQLSSLQAYDPDKINLIIIFIHFCILFSFSVSFLMSDEEIVENCCDDDRIDSVVVELSEFISSIWCWYLKDLEYKEYEFEMD